MGTHVAEALLRPFLATDRDLFLSFVRPAVGGIWRYYTDGRVMVRVPVEWPTDMPDGKAPTASFESQDWSHNEVGEWVTLNVVLPPWLVEPGQPCQECEGSGQVACMFCQAKGRRACPECGTADVVCSECDGSGRVECEECEGTGKSEGRRASDSVRVGDVLLGSVYLGNMLALPGLEVASDDLADRHRDVAVRFRFADGAGQGLIMPRRD